MALTNYGTLKTAVASWLDDDNLDAHIPDFISLGESMIYSERKLIKLRAFEDIENVEIDEQMEALPQRFLGVRRFYLSGNPNSRLDYVTPDAFYNKYLGSETGKPEAYTIEGDFFTFGPSPDATYTGKLVYFKAFARFAGDSDTNELLTDHPNLFLYSALIHSAPFLGDDPRIGVWAALYDQIVDNLWKANRTDRFPVPAQFRNDIEVV